MACPCLFGHHGWAEHNYDGEMATKSKQESENEAILDALKRQHQRDIDQVAAGEMDATALYMFTKEQVHKSVVVNKPVDLDGLLDDYA